MVQFSRMCSAIVGAAVFQGLYMLQEVPTSFAAWTWTMQVPADKGFNCSEGGTIGGGPKDNFNCTVVPDSGKECDVTDIHVLCYKTKNPDVTFHPPNTNKDTLCLNVGHKAGQADNDNDSMLMWSAVPSCKDKNKTKNDFVDASVSQYSLSVGVLACVGLAAAEHLR
eukprot:TRINITY_DN1136_c0_g1_i4.p2 TRINITY_DN1136_c0_g1~~TRINITY_DN1136_c0_g1_i4.p2  ORF type:complete len:190 (-),score=47.91 TRINITY_DN1136_c0_g1_i4:290-790(-)